MTNYIATNVDLIKAHQSTSRWRGAFTYPYTNTSATYTLESSITELAKSPLSIACLFNKDIVGSFCDDLYPGDETTFQSLRLTSSGNHKHANMDTFVDTDIDVDFDFNSNIEINFEAADINTEMRHESNFQGSDTNFSKEAVSYFPNMQDCDINVLGRKTDSLHEGYLDIFDESVARDSLVISIAESSEDRSGGMDFIMDFNQVLNEFESWSEGIDYGSTSDSQPTLIQDPINISFDIEIIGKNCHENWFDAVERRYIQEIGFY